MPRYRFVAELWIDAENQQDAEEEVGFILEADRLLNASMTCLGKTTEKMPWEDRGD